MCWYEYAVHLTIFSWTSRRDARDEARASEFLCACVERGCYVAAISWSEGYPAHKKPRPVPGYLAHTNPLPAGTRETRCGRSGWSCRSSRASTPPIRPATVCPHTSAKQCFVCTREILVQGGGPPLSILICVLAWIVVNFRTTNSQKCAAVPRRARI